MDSVSIPLERESTSSQEDFFKERGKILLDILTNEGCLDALTDQKEFLKKK